MDQEPKERGLQDKRRKGVGSRIAIGMTLGMMFGYALGAGIDNWAVGILFGVGMGVAFSLAFGKKSSGVVLIFGNRRNRRPPENHD